MTYDTEPEYADLASPTGPECDPVRTEPQSGHANNLASALRNVHDWVKRTGHCTCAHTDGSTPCTSAQVLAAYDGRSEPQKSDDRECGREWVGVGHQHRCTLIGAHSRHYCVVCGARADNIAMSPSARSATEKEAEHVDQFGHLVNEKGERIKDPACELCTKLNGLPSDVHRSATEKEAERTFAENEQMCICRHKRRVHSREGFEECHWCSECVSFTRRGGSAPEKEAERIPDRGTSGFAYTNPDTGTHNTQGEPGPSEPEAPAESELYMGRERLCSDKEHDPRWCSTCENMQDGYDRALDDIAKLSAPGPGHAEHVIEVAFEHDAEADGVDMTPPGATQRVVFE